MQLIFDYNLSELSSYKIGGKAKYLFIPKNVFQLKKAIRFAKRRNLKPICFGLGTNVVFPDQPAENLFFISLKELKIFKYNKRRLFLSAGIPSSMLSIIGILSNTSDLFFTHLLPGSIGGGIFMNARCYDNDFCSVVKKIYYLDENLTTKTIERDYCKFSYKNSIFQSKNWIIIGADFSLNESLSKSMEKKLKNFIKIKKNLSYLNEFFDFFSLKSVSNFFNEKTIPQKVKEIEEDRIKKHHFDFPSCGSVFKNNYDIGIPMGKLIEMAGLKGISSGGAKISEFHGNFIINESLATQEDIINLIKIVKEKIYKTHGFTPEPEVRIIEND